MSALEFSRLSKVSPNPHTTNCGNGGDTSYTCHSAVLHWAYMDHGCSQIEANQRVTALTRATCPGCKTPGMPHSSIVAHRYGEMFCHTAVRVYRNSLHTSCQPGDVLITGHPTLPNHSMVVRQVRGPNHVTIRGFNNIGTLGTGNLLQYDNSSHNITQDKYWASPGLFGANTPGIELYRIPYINYSSQVARTMRMAF